ncbi:MAG: Retaining alpha-galactosidase precursor [Bacteroidetes bacterium]|nr:Retaining alpha-galactosidase precursor [Bacteroidota bacterium]
MIDSTERDHMPAMIRYGPLRLIAVLLAALPSLALLSAPADQDMPVSATSPDGKVRIELSLRSADGSANVPHYRILFGGNEVIGYSRLGVELAGGPALGSSCTLESTETRTVREAYEQVTGKRRAVTSHGTEILVRLRELDAPRLRWEVRARAYDDGAAFRYGFPAQDGWDTLRVAREMTEFRFPPEASAVALPLNKFTTSYEKRYQTMAVSDLPRTWLLALPLLVRSSGGLWAAVTEANILEYAGMYLAPSGDGRVTARLSPLPGDTALSVRAALPHASPWRVVMLADRVGRLVESDIVLNLSEPCAISDVSWIRTGKTTFPWWNGFYEEGVPFEPGLNTATALHYIDFCAESGIPYHSLDGLGNTAWYGGPIVPYEGADPTRALDGLDLHRVLNHAKAKGVKIRLWMHWKAAARFMESSFPLYREWGIEGIMLDFMDRDDQEMNRFVRHAVSLAAENHLTVTLHGCPKPTGLERTYPNLLTHEAVMNLEYDKWDPIGITPEHELTVPFTRMLAGPLDFHQGSFRAVKPGEFKTRMQAPLVIGTPARTLAGYVVLQNHLPMVADYPTAYRGHPGTPVLVSIPTTWDDTRVLEAEVGRYAVIARRHGAAWHIGAMTDLDGRTLAVPLRFLGPGQFVAEMWVDDSAAPHGLSPREQHVASSDVLELTLEAGGGAYARLTPAP